MTPNEQRFIDAAIAKRRAYYAHREASLAVFDATPFEHDEAVKARQNTAMKCVDADTEYGMASKLVTDPFVPNNTIRLAPNNAT